MHFFCSTDFKMDITYETMQSSPTKLRHILRQNPEILVIVPEQHPCYSIVAFNGDKPIGVVVAYERDRRELYIRSIRVTKDHHRKGVGTVLLAMLEKVAREKKLDTLSLHVYDWNYGATSLYTKLGFVEERFLGSSFRFWIKRLD